MAPRPLGRAALLAVLIALAAPPLATAQTVTAYPPTGPIEGVVTPVMHEFLGIPYAEPPVGALRWRPPVARAPWTTPLDASAFGGRCAQVGGPFGEASTNEDCLYLNVYVPHRKSVPERDLRRKRPVMVWIHGGAFQSGSAENYDPTKLVTEGDVIVVTINYRLGTLGFLAHPALSAESPADVSGNYGILDQQLALRWVQDNIAAFGGNPRKVTIFGESAGGISVHVHMASPLAAGTFQRAIAQSGAVFVQPTIGEGETQGATLADALGCSDQSAECLRGLGVDDILADQPLGLRTASPVVDGVVLPTDLRTAFASGNFNRVPLIEGSNHDEMRLFVALLFDLQGGPLTDAEYVDGISALLGVPTGVAGVLATQYPAASYPSAGLALSALATDAAFACNAFAVNRSVSGLAPVYAYEFADENAPATLLPPVSFPYGAAHAFELNYLFTLPQAFPQAFSPEQETLSDTMVGYWTRFARTGKPSARHAPRWPRFDVNLNPSFLSLQPPAPLVLRESSFRGDHRCPFWDNVLN
jgi:para-nitrobenzyl esterase